MSLSAKSIRAKLLHIAQKENLSFQLIIVRYFQERLLFRISQSEYKHIFCLKGGVLLYLYFSHKSRPTMDIDFLASRIKNDRNNLLAIFTEICEIPADDAVVFDTNNIDAFEIIKQGNYSGVRINLTCRLDTIVQRIQIDVGFGDQVYPNPVLIQYPVLLNMAQPEISAYSIYSAIAEKFEAMIQLSDANSRMKDFYDIYTLLKFNFINKYELEEAIRLTFSNRRTILSLNHSIFQENFITDIDRKRQWNVFLKKANVQEDLLFENVMLLIKSELKPIYDAMLRNGNY